MIPTTLPADSQARKDVPLLSGCLRYAPAALAGMARWSKIGNDKHNPGESLHHARGKSSDHGDCILRHLTDIQDIVAAFERQNLIAGGSALQQLMDECDALVWRAALLSQELHEKFAGAPLAPGARLPPLEHVLTFSTREAMAMAGLVPKESDNGGNQAAERDCCDA